MNEFTANHVETLASIITILGGMGAMLGFFWRHIDKRFEKMDLRFDKLEAEQQKFHTRLTWLDGYIAGHETPERKRK